jgi:double-stranded uracil-DNA glycosylase
MSSGPVPDVVAAGLHVLFVGINPGFVSARAGHHFANPANGFWRLLYESGFTPRKLQPSEDRQLLERRIGITNLVSRPTAGVADIARDDFERGRRALGRKIRRLEPKAVVFVGITAYRAFRGGAGPIACGEQPQRIRDARVFVVPNPSGRNAHFKYADMLALFRGVARELGYG